jgi:hypothetical protein
MAAANSRSVAVARASRSGGHLAKRGVQDTLQTNKPLIGFWRSCFILSGEEVRR